MNGKIGKQRMGRINLRPVLFCALGLFAGVTLYYDVALGRVSYAGFVFYALFFALALVPFSWKRVCFVLATALLFGGLGALSAHLALTRFSRGEEGKYEVTGTVISVTVKEGYSQTLLDDLTFDGEAAGGKMLVRLSSETPALGDIVRFSGNVEKTDAAAEGSYGDYLLSEDIRYTSHGEYNCVGRSGNVLLFLNENLRKTLDRGMGGEEAQVAYALLTGNSHGMDGGLLETVRRGGIAHIFAVSGLHIGILYGAVAFLGRPLKRYAFVPATAVCLLYTAFCAFTPSSVRALIMCTAVGVTRAFGEKYDLLEGISVAALLILLFSPASARSAGFLLSFGACLGLALYGGPLNRAFRKLRGFGGYLAAYLAVQTLTVPILLSCFGYLPLLGIVLNFLILPVLPVLFLTVLLVSFAALLVPALSVLLVIPKGLLSLFLLVISSAEATLVLSGFSLGAGAAVWTAGFVLSSERVRMRPTVRALAAAGACALFAVCLALENISLRGRVYVFSRGEGDVAFLEAGNTAVLVIDSEASLSLCEDALSRRYAGTLDAVFVLGEDELKPINIAAALHPACICAQDEIATGLQTQRFCFGKRMQIGKFDFYYEGRDRLFCTANGVSVEFGFEKPEIGGDFFVPEGSGGLIFSF